MVSLWEWLGFDTVSEEVLQIFVVGTEIKRDGFPLGISDPIDEMKDSRSLEVTCFWVL